MYHQRHDLHVHRDGASGHNALHGDRSAFLDGNECGYSLGIRHDDDGSSNRHGGNRES